jgi:ubiquitin-conjugating enzyme E2 O
MKLPHGGKPPHLGQFESAKQGAGSNSSFHSNFVGHNGSLHPQGLESRNPWLKSFYNLNAPPEYAHPQGLQSINPWLKYNFNAPPGYAHPQGLESRNPWLNSSYNFNAPPGYAHPHALESRNPWLKSSYNFNALPEHAHPQGLESKNPSLKSSYNFNAPPEHTHNEASAVSPSLTSITDEPDSETLRKLRSFKQFDTVVDTSDHYFVNNNSSMQHVS